MRVQGTPMKSTITLLLAALALGGCSSIGRELNQAMPAFMRYEPGQEEMEIFMQVRKGREWTPEDLADQERIATEARSAYAEGRYGDTVVLVEEYLERYPTSSFDEEIRFLLAESHYASDDLSDAFKACRDFSALYPVSPRSAQIMDMEYAIGKEYIEGRQNSFFGLLSNTKRGEEILNHLVETYPSGQRAADAQWLICQYYFGSEDWPKAEGAFQLLAENYPRSEWYPAAMFYTAYSAYRQTKGLEYDPATMYRARAAFGDYLSQVDNPQWAAEAKAIVAALEDLEAGHLLYVGKWYLGQGKPYSARYYLNAVIAKYPESGAAVEAEQSLPELADLRLTAPETEDESAPAPEAESGGAGT